MSSPTRRAKHTLQTLQRLSHLSGRVGGQCRLSSIQGWKRHLGRARAANGEYRWICGWFPENRTAKHGETKRPDASLWLPPVRVWIPALSENKMRPLTLSERSCFTPLLSIHHWIERVYSESREHEGIPENCFVWRFVQEVEEVWVTSTSLLVLSRLSQTQRVWFPLPLILLSRLEDSSWGEPVHCP